MLSGQEKAWGTMKTMLDFVFRGKKVFPYSHYQLSKSIWPLWLLPTSSVSHSLLPNIYLPMVNSQSQK